MSLTFLIIVLTAISSYAALQNRNVMGRAMLIPSLMRSNGEWHRFLTHGFIHRDFWHALVNLFVLWMFGGVVESGFRMAFGPLGPLLFAVLYIGGIAAAALPVFWRRQHDPGYASLGASGAVSGVVFAYIVFYPLEQICLYFVLCLPSVLMGIAYLAYSSYMDRRGGGNVAHDAHMYGALWGLAFTVLLCLSMAPEVIRHALSSMQAALPF